MNSSLHDIRVLEIGQVLAGPFAGMILGDLGAEVIKIEQPGCGDSARRTPPHFYKGESIYFMTLNRNKKSIALDLSREEGREIFYALVKKSDVVVDNLRPGVPEKLQINHEVLAALNPAIISCSINGYGSDTPERSKPAFDLMIQARGGGMSLTGEAGGPPMRMGVSISDHVAGIYAVTGILAALHARQQTGMGQKVEVPLFSAMLSLLSYEAGFCLYSGEAPGPVGAGHRSLIPYNAVKTEDGYIVIDAHLPKFWSALCRVLAIEGLEKDPAFSSLQARNEHRSSLLALLEKAFVQKNSRTWLALLEAAGVPCAPINDLCAALADPATQALHMVADIEHTSLGMRFKATANPIRMSAVPATRYQSPPLLGEHTTQILQTILNYSEEALAKLRGEDWIQ